MTAYINNLPNDYWVLVGIKLSGSYELDPPAMLALQSLGMDPDIVIDTADGFAMIGKKGAVPGSVP